MSYRVYFLYLLAFLMASTIVILIQFPGQYKNTIFMDTVEYLYQGMMNQSIYGRKEAENTVNNETGINYRTTFNTVNVSTLKFQQTANIKTITKIITTTKLKVNATSKVNAKTSKPRAITKANTTVKENTRTNANKITTLNTTIKANTTSKENTNTNANILKTLNATIKANTTSKVNTKTPTKMGVIKNANSTTKVNASTKVNIITKAKKTTQTEKEASPKYKIYDGIYPNVTIVTAYFNIGTFNKGEGNIKFDIHLYEKWADIFKNLNNPLIFYTDFEEFKNVFAKVRSKHLNTTKIVRVNRKDVWSFDWLDRIKKIYSIKGYPKHSPNTVVPEYSCVQHAKHAVVEDAILKKYVTTKYVTWLDVGYFRDLQSDTKRNKAFWIVKPDNFNDSRIAVNEVYGRNIKADPQSIFKRNMVWIGGGMAFGVPKVYLDFVQDYKRAVERYLDMSIMNTDQQVLYAMNLPQEKNILKSKVDLQIYRPNNKMSTGPWFALGYSCYREEA